MLSIYFDQEFIKAFGERTDLTDPVIYDFFNQFIKRIRGVDIFVNMQSIDQLKELIFTNEFYALISENKILLSNFKDQLDNESFYEDGSITKLFFIENCNEKHLQNNYGYYFISNKTLKEKWKVFLSDRDDKELIIKSNPRLSENGIFRAWKDLNLFTHKIKNILVFDLYAMTNKKDQKIAKNILPCIAELVSKNNNMVDDLTIFTKGLADNNQKKNGLQDIWQENDFTVSSAYFESLSTQIKNIYFVKYDESKNTKADSEHNRFILTNYFYIRVEAGLNIFKDNGKVNHRDTIRFDSILKNTTRNIVEQALKNIKQYASQLKDMETKAIGKGEILEHYNFSPELNCRFLK